MPLPPITPDKVHDMAETAMQGLLSSNASRRSVSVTAENNNRTFNEELAFEAYDIAEALISESVTRV